MIARLASWQATLRTPALYLVTTARQVVDRPAAAKGESTLTSRRGSVQCLHYDQQAASVAMETIRMCCSRALRVDLNDSDPSYVLKAVHNSAVQAVATSTSNHIIKLYQLDANSGQLQHVNDLKGHGNSISEIGFGLPEIPHLLHSSSADGTVRGWDIRSGQQVEGFRSSGAAELYSFSILGHMVAAGGPGSLLFWDRRNPSQQLAKLEDTHMDEVTQVRFHSSGRLLSASTDGLVAVHDVSQSFDDDEVFQAAMNASTSVEEIGLWGSNLENLWLRTGTESLHLWEWMAATQDDTEGGSLPLAEFPEARSSAAAAASLSSAAVQLQQVDYLIGCQYDAISSQLLLMAGTIAGDVGFFPLQLPVRSTASASSALGTSTSQDLVAAIQPPVALLSGGHNTIVRTVLCLPHPHATVQSGQPACITGGEDARVCLWSVSAPGATTGGGLVQQGSPGPDRKHRKAGGDGTGPRRPSPY